MLTRSPAFKTRSPGMPCTTSSLTEMQLAAGNGTLPRTPLNKASAPASRKTSSMTASSSRVATPGRMRRAARSMRSGDQAPRFAHQRDLAGLLRTITQLSESSNPG